MGLGFKVANVYHINSAHGSLLGNVLGPQLRYQTDPYVHP